VPFGFFVVPDVCVHVVPLPFPVAFGLVVLLFSRCFLVGGSYVVDFLPVTRSVVDCRLFTFYLILRYVWFVYRCCYVRGSFRFPLPFVFVAIVPTLFVYHVDFVRCSRFPPPLLVPLLPLPFVCSLTLFDFVLFVVVTTPPRSHTFVLLLPFV